MAASSSALEYCTRVVWTAAGQVVERFRTTSEPDSERFEDARETFSLDDEGPFLLPTSAQQSTAAAQLDPFLSFEPEAWAVKDLGDFTDPLDFTDRSDRTDEASTAREGEEEEIPALVDPAPLLPAHVHAPVRLSEPSALLTADDCRALASALPVRHRWRQWHLLYSSSRDGISLATLFRRAECGLPTILVVRDTQRHVFGCFTQEPWHNAPRYFGNGETFVYQTQPNLYLWRWHQRRMAVARNDFFQWGRPDRLAVGGAPHYALSLDGDLLTGSSGTCDTFGSTCLAGSDEFEVGRVELWGLS